MTFREMDCFICRKYKTEAFLSQSRLMQLQGNIIAENRRTKVKTSESKMNNMHRNLDEGQQTYLGSDLIAALPSLHMHDFAHLDWSGVNKVRKTI